MIGRRVCDVKIKKSNEVSIQQVKHKVLIGMCTEDISAGNIGASFGGYGGVADVFIPKPPRVFSLVNLLDPVFAQSLRGEDHIVKGT
ncbi:TAR DNA-binding protein 43 [Armadillidium vulgare]|nr:TAR DNA-binding protein 43 [Armadillidium vulgare]